MSDPNSDASIEAALGCHVVDKKCIEPYEYLANIPGKDVRGMLMEAFQVWLNIPEDVLCAIKDIVASLHNASLLIDDIEDNSKLRRGVPVAHSIYGVANTINCANYVYFLALEKCHSLNCAPAMNVFVQELLNLHRGQGQDILWREQCSCPTEEEYRQMVLDKTGGLFRLAVGLMQAFSPTVKTNFGPLLNLLSLYFQIRDDFLNVSSVAYMQTKSFCEDLTEGKFSFPIIHAVRNRPGDSRLLSILRQRTEDEAVKRYAVQWMQQCGSITYTRDCLKQLYSEIRKEIASLGGHDGLMALLEKLDAQLDKDESEKITRRPINKSSSPRTQHAVSPLPVWTSSYSSSVGGCGLEVVPALGGFEDAAISNAVAAEDRKAEIRTNRFSTDDAVWHGSASVAPVQPEEGAKGLRPKEVVDEGGGDSEGDDLVSTL